MHAWADWKDKLEEQFRTKRQKEDAEVQRRAAHDNFIQSHGHNAWKELAVKVHEGCDHLTSHAGAKLTFMRDGDQGFIIAGGIKPLDVSFDLPTRVVTWGLRDMPNRGKLQPDRVGDELIYRGGDNQTFSVEDAAAFLIQKVF